VSQHGHSCRGFLKLVETATILGDGNARTGNLTFARFATQLRHQFENLCDAGCANRVAFGYEAAGRIDRYRSTEGRRT
jgi:hypothetical protein